MENLFRCGSAARGFRNDGDLEQAGGDWEQTNLGNFLGK